MNAIKTLFIHLCLAVTRARINSVRKETDEFYRAMINFAACHAENKKFLAELEKHEISLRSQLNTGKDTRPITGVQQ